MIDTPTPTPLLLEHLREEARRAYSGISLVPEKRAERIVQDYSKELSELTSRVHELDEGSVKEFQDGYISRMRAWLAAKSRCTSVMITGPSGFNSHRAEKANKSESKRYEEWAAYKESYISRLEKRVRREIMEANGITQLDVDLRDARKNLEEREASQEFMRSVNKAVRSKQSAEEKISQLSEATGISLAEATGQIQSGGYEPYQLSNNLANIKRLRRRVSELEAKVSMRATGNMEYPFGKFGGGKVVLNHDQDRVQLFLDSESKPSDEIRTLLKSHPLSLKWSPRNGAWQRKITANAVIRINRALGLDIPVPLSSSTQ